MRTLITLLILTATAQAGVLEDNLRHVMFVSSAADMIQTCNIHSTPDTWEMNPVLGKQPHVPYAVAWFAVTTLGWDYLARQTEDPVLRNLMYIIPVVVESYLTLLNNPPNHISDDVRIQLVFTIPF